jgi:protein TonB
MKTTLSLCLAAGLIGLPGCSTPPATKSSAATTTALSRPPTVISRTLPIYPVELMKLGVTGVADVEFILDTEGNVRNAFAVNATNEAFGRAAVNCIQQWKFTPGIMNGRPVNTRLRQSFDFALSEDPKK